jgi:SAM-dependent methyltransferase
VTVTRYDTIGRTYAETRRTEPRIAAQIAAALGDARTVVNIGAGAGSYESSAFEFVAVEPSLTMLRQRDRGAAPAVCARAEALPIADGAFDAALAVLTVHHWSDLELGLREMRRVSRRQVIFYFEPAASHTFWLFRDYFPETPKLISERDAPGTARLSELLPVRAVEIVPVPSDCRDGFACAFWNRPEAYLDPTVQAGTSTYSQLDPSVVARGTALLREDLASGAWDAKHGALRGLAEMDFGYRLLIAQ